MHIIKRFFSVKVFKTKFVENYLSKNNLDFLMSKKDLLVNSSVLKHSPKNLTLINSSVFFRTSKLVKFRRRISNNTKEKLKILNSNKLANKFFLVDLAVLNSSIEKERTKKLYNFFARFKYSLFNKNFNLLLDLVKVTNLLCEKKVNIKLFVILLSNVFRRLHKRQHSKFFLFIKELSALIGDLYPSIEGIRLEINGRLLGKLRASGTRISFGRLSSNSFVTKSLFYQTHVYTLYGTFGFKMTIKNKEIVTL